MTYRFIDQHKDRWPVRLLCQTLEVSAAGYYAWQQRPRREQPQRRDTLVVEMRTIHAEFKARYGSEVPTKSGHEVKVIVHVPTQEGGNEKEPRVEFGGVLSEPAA